LLQHAEPSSGCAQHAPPLSCGVSLGVQQAEALVSFGVQQPEAAGAASFFSFVIFAFSTMGSSKVFVFINKCFYTYIDEVPGE